MAQQTYKYTFTTRITILFLFFWTHIAIAQVSGDIIFDEEEDIVIGAGTIPINEEAHIIIKEGGYEVNGAVTLIAREHIILKPNTWIKPGSSFSAKLDPYLPVNYIPITLDNTKNYIFTRLYQNAVYSTINTNSDIIDEITYFDGIGRPIQQRAIKASPDLKDIVTHIPYDAFGRQVRQYLPFESQEAGGNFQNVDVVNNINSYYKNTYGDDFQGITQTNVNAYSEQLFESSPLNRVLKHGAPGQTWKAISNSETDHTIKFDWRTNTSSEVHAFQVNYSSGNTESPTLQQNGFYTPDELYVSRTKDENWSPDQTYSNDHTIIEYKDKLGRIILKRTYNKNIPHDTYYVYDDFDNLVYVLPPKVNLQDGVSANELNTLCYQYRYDYRNRLIEKKIPGKGWEYIVYNRLDWPVLTQDANLRAQNKWLFTKYDAFGRVIYTGLKNIDRSRSSFQETITNSTTEAQFEQRTTGLNTIAGTILYYTGTAIPKEMDEILTINYYDDYAYAIAPDASNPGIVLGQPVTTNVTSLVTGTQVRVLGTDDWITTTNYYDIKGRLIYLYMHNTYLQVTESMSYNLDFIGKTLETKTTHTKTGHPSIETTDLFKYDHMGRLIRQTQQINNQEAQEIVLHTYDATGLMVQKETGGGVQTVDYTYNIRGWLQKINDPVNLGIDLFGFQINYDQPVENLQAAPLYNGNISETIWKTANDGIKRAYGYQYDGLNRITEAIDNSADHRYTVSNISYDKNGNIQHLERNGHTNENATIFGQMDNLTYTYDVGNKLRKVQDSGNPSFGFRNGTNTNDDYAYDDNGNMTLDRNKGISGVSYNHLNLPLGIIMDPTGLTNDGTIDYVYDATGVKLEKRVTRPNGIYSTTSYAGNYIYDRPGQYIEEKLSLFFHPEGYVEQQDNDFKYIYQCKDHLGNIRLSYTTAEDYEVLTDHDFSDDLGDWNLQGGVTAEQEDGRMKISVAGRWKGIYQDIPATLGKQLTIRAVLDKGTTERVTMGIAEYDFNNNFRAWHQFDIVDGKIEASFALTSTTAYFRVVIDKQNGADNGVLTSFFVDDVRLNLSDLDIIEENNYYPFGLQHKGYNNIVSGNINSVANKFKYNGQELEESLGLNLYEMDLRQYDPTIARWNGIDPVTHYDYSTYSAFDNNPVFWADPSGADSTTYINEESNGANEETDHLKSGILEKQSNLKETSIYNQNDNRKSELKDDECPYPPCDTPDDEKSPLEEQFMHQKDETNIIVLDKINGILKAQAKKQKALVKYINALAAAGVINEITKIEFLGEVQSILSILKASADGGDAFLAEISKYGLSKALPAAGTIFTLHDLVIAVGQMQRSTLKRKMLNGLERRYNQDRIDKQSYLIQKDLILNGERRRKEYRDWKYKYTRRF